MAAVHRSCSKAIKRKSRPWHLTQAAARLRPHPRTSRSESGTQTEPVRRSYSRDIKTRSARWPLVQMENASFRAPQTRPCGFGRSALARCKMRCGGAPPIACRKHGVANSYLNQQVMRRQSTLSAARKSPGRREDNNHVQPVSAHTVASEAAWMAARMAANFPTCCCGPITGTECVHSDCYLAGPAPQDFSSAAGCRKSSKNGTDSALGSEHGQRE